LVCIQGLGFVGTAMALAVADARDENGRPRFNVIGVELGTPAGLAKIEAINNGHLPMRTDDPKLQQALDRAVEAGNLTTTTDPEAYRRADVVVVDVHCDVDFESAPSEFQPTKLQQAELQLDGLKAAIQTVGDRMRQDCLVLVETTVPPGTCERILAPLLKDRFQSRGLDPDQVLLAHSYERVMPGPDYFDSIINFWRVYSGLTTEAADWAEAFLSKIINTKDYPLRRLQSPTASESAKVLENTYRAVNIAFIQEWSDFAEAAGIDLFDIISAIRVRPTHSNIRQPGFGVGGYCLTKDPMFAPLAAKQIFERDDVQFPFSLQAVQINRKMPLTTLRRVERHLGGLRGKKILLLGVSYRSGVADTRYSASEVFYRQAIQAGALVTCHDPKVDFWEELNLRLPSELPSAGEFDAAVLAVDHSEYKNFAFDRWAEGAELLIFDANNVLNKAMRERLRRLGCDVASLGRGADCA